MEHENPDKPFAVAKEITGNETPLSHNQVEICAETVSALIDPLSGKIENKEKTLPIQQEPCFQVALIYAILADYSEVIENEYGLDIEKLKDSLINLVFKNEKHDFTKTELENTYNFVYFISNEALPTEKWGCDVLINPWIRLQMNIEILAL